MVSFGCNSPPRPPPFLSPLLLRFGTEWRARTKPWKGHPSASQIYTRGAPPRPLLVASVAHAGGLWGPQGNHCANSPHDYTPPNVNPLHNRFKNSRLFKRRASTAIDEARRASVDQRRASRVSAVTGVPLQQSIRHPSVTSPPRASFGHTTGQFARCLTFKHPSRFLTSSFASIEAEHEGSVQGWTWHKPPVVGAGGF